jgi:hypothetical protein
VAQHTRLTATVGSSCSPKSQTATGGSAGRVPSAQPPVHSVPCFAGTLHDQFASGCIIGSGVPRQSASVQTATAMVP